MGFFDSIIKDIANGDLDKKLEKLADSIDKISGKLDDTVEKIVEKPEQLAERAKVVGNSGKKVIDIIVT